LRKFVQLSLGLVTSALNRGLQLDASLGASLGYAFAADIPVGKGKLGAGIAALYKSPERRNILG